MPRRVPESDRWLRLGFLPWDRKMETPLHIHVPPGRAVAVFCRVEGKTERTIVEIDGLHYPVQGSPSEVQASIAAQMSGWIVPDDPGVVKC